MLLYTRLSSFSPENRLRINHERLEGLDKRMELAVRKYITRLDTQLNEKLIKLDSLSPVKVLSRGYSLVYKGGSLINDTDKLKKGDTVRIRFGTGEAEAEIINI